MKVISDPQTRQYELTFLVPTTYTETERKAVQEKVEKLVERHKGTIIESEDWGKKPMAYAIRHNGQPQTEAAYTHLVIEFTTTEAPAFELDFKLIDEIMRHLMVVAEDSDDSEKTEEKSEE